MNTFDKTKYHYTALFCEENIWKLIESNLAYSSMTPIDVLFIINQSNSIALFEQHKSNGKQAVIWDYHVVLSAEVNNNLVVFDFDSRCEFPCDINSYFNKTFARYNQLADHHQALLRPIKADYYYQNFTSERSHMLGLIPQSEFPDYDIIIPNGTTNLLTLENCRALSSEIPESHILTPHAYLEKLNSTAKSNF